VYSALSNLHKLLPYNMDTEMYNMATILILKAASVPLIALKYISGLQLLVLVSASGIHSTRNSRFNPLPTGIRRQGIRRSLHKNSPSRIRQSDQTADSHASTSPQMVRDPRKLYGSRSGRLDIVLLQRILHTDEELGRSERLQCHCMRIDTWPKDFRSHPMIEY
jgi:hypothetical protein